MPNGPEFDHAQYLLLMAACLAITLPLEFVLRARVYRRWRVALFAVVPVVVVYTAWDLLGIVREHWWYNPEFVTGWHIGVVPIEELVFFVVIPLCGLLTYEAVGTVLGWGRSWSSSRARRAGAAAEGRDA